MEAGSLAWSPDGTTLAYVDKSLDQEEHDAVMLWNFKANRAQPLAGAKGRLQVVAFSPDGSRLAAGGTDLSIHIWDLAGRELHVIATAADTGAISALAWSPCGTMIASSCDGAYQGVAIWDVDSGMELGILPSHLGGDRSLLWLASPSTIVGSGGNRDGRSRYYDLDLGTVPREFETGRSLLCRVGSTDKAVMIEENGKVHFCEPTGMGGVVAELPVNPSVPSSLASAPDGKTLACGTEEGLIRFVETDSGKLLGQFVMNGAVRRLTYSPDASMLAVTTENWGHQGLEPTTEIRSAKSGDVLWELDVSRNQQIDDVAWSPDGNLLATTGDELRIWKGTDKGLVNQYRLGAKSVVWMSAGAAVALASPSGVTVLDAATGSDIYTFPESSDSPRLMAWSEQAGRLAVTYGRADDPQIALLAADSGEPKLRLSARNHIQPIIALGWGADGKSLLSGSPADTCVWDVEKEKGNWLRTIGTSLFTPAPAPSEFRRPRTGVRFVPFCGCVTASTLSSPPTGTIPDRPNWGNFWRTLCRPRRASRNSLPRSSPTDTAGRTTPRK
jgi:WD40 repeat protein